MGATYTRQSTYADGDTITSDHTNDEFDQLLAAFAASTGHTHDGTTAEGGPVTKLLGTSLTFGNGTSGTDITVTFDGESNDGVFKWMEDEDYFEFSDDLLIASTEKIQFRDTGIYLNSSADGQLDIVADTEIQIAATTVDINGNVDISGTLTIGGAGISEAELEVLDGATISTGEINILDGDTSATSTTVVDADRVVLNDNGTMVQVAVTDLAAYFDDEITAMPNLVTTAATTVGALNSGSITSGFGTINTGASTITTTGLISGGSLDIDDVLINGATIGHTSDTDLITLADSVVTVAGEVSVTTLDIGGTNVTSTAAELNILDGKAFLDEDNLATNSATGIASQQSIKAYVDAATGSNIVSTGALNSGSITSGFGNIDTGSSTITTTGLISGGSLDIDNVLINGTTIGHTDDTDLITLADGVVTVAGEVSMTTLDIGGTNVTSTATELNKMDGGTSATSTTVADADRVVMNDNGTMVQVAVTDLAAYFDDEITAMPNLTSVGTLTALAVDDVAINGKIMTMTGSTDDTAVFTVGTNGALSIITTDDSAAAANIQITADGTAELAGTTVTLDSAGDIALDATNDINIPSEVGLTFGDDGEKIEGDGTDLAINSSGDLNITATTIDIDGNVEISGTAVTTGVHTFTAVPVFPNNTVETADIQADAITGAKIADDAINSEHYTDGSIDTAHIADNQVTLAKMAGLARGKLIIGDSSGDPVVLGPGNDGQVLTSDGTDIAFADADGGGTTIPAGTLMLFNQTAAPTGFTKSTSHNDKAIRITSGSVGTGGSVAFETAFASQSVSVAATTIAISTMAAHSHVQGFAGVNASAGFGVSSAPAGNVNSQSGQSGGNHANTSTVGGGGSHTHAGTAIDLDVAYVDVIIAEKD